MYHYSSCPNCQNCSLIDPTTGRITDVISEEAIKQLVIDGEAERHWNRACLQCIDAEEEVRDVYKGEHS